MPVRRAADPTSVQHVWDAIRAANAQRQMADLQRIIKYLQRVDKCSQAQAELYLQQALNDGLVVELHKVTVKGSKAGTEVESYKIPVQEQPAPEDDGKDWYCIDCHLAGDVTPCQMCCRVFHAECAHKNKLQSNKFEADLDSPADRKRMTYLPPAADSPRDEVIEQDQNNSEESQIEPPKEKTVVDLNDQDATLNRLVDDVEKKLEKMEESEDGKLEESFIMNSTAYSDTNSEENISQELEIDKENSISSSKNSDVIIALNDEDKSVYDVTLCSICNMFRTEPELDLEKEELNYLLTFVHSRIKSWVPISITDTVPPDAKPEWLTEAEVNWRAKQLFYQPMNMAIIEAKLQTKEYDHICQFKADVLTVRHNAAIYHGIESQEFDCADFLWKDCDRELSELSNCVDCFRHSNEKINSKWFCLPCRIPHKLVWAKQKGYPYWPAKVIKETEDMCDVRFFGGKYERSVLPKMYIKPITANMSNQQAKKSSALSKSVEELMIHQKLLEDPSEVQKYIGSGRKKKHVIKPIKVIPNNKMPKALGAIKKRSKSMDLPKDVYEFRDSPNLDASTSGVQSSTPKRKRSASPLPKVKPTTSRTSEYPTRRAVQNQINKSKATVTIKNGTTKANATVSSGVDNEEQFAIRDEDYEFGRGYDGSHQEVTSSTEQIQSGDESYARDSDGLMPQTERQYSEAVEKTRRKLEQCREKKQLIKVALECMQAEIDTINNTHDDFVKKMFEAHNAQISETKKKQWCFNCEQDAIYHCCWNTAYCSPTCQQQHWQAEHKKVCRRKR